MALQMVQFEKFLVAYGTYSRDGSVSMMMVLNLTLYGISHCGSFECLRALGQSTQNKRCGSMKLISCSDEAIDRGSAVVSGVSASYV